MHGPLRAQAELSFPTEGVFAAAATRWLDRCNRIIVVLSAVALIAACAILSYSVVTRSLFKAATYWQDEAAVFLLVGATFMTGAYVQGQRGRARCRSYF